MQMLFEPDTVLPLSAGIPGVSIESEPASSNYSLARYNIAVQKLSISNEMYDYLRVTHSFIFTKIICSSSSQ